MRLLRFRRPAPVAQSTRPAEHYLAASADEARRLGHSVVGTEHLLLALTRDPDRPAARILAGSIENSHVGEGCLIGHSTVRNSILGRGVHVAEGCVVEDSIVMDGTRLEKGVRLRRAIVDRFNIVPADAEIGLDPAADRQRWHVDPSGLVVVPRGGRREFLSALDEP